MNARITGAVAAVLLAASASAVHAQNWQFEPRLQLGYEYNDNYRLDFPGEEIEVSGGLLDVSLPLRLLDPTTKAEIAPRVRATLFPDERDEDSTDYFVNGLLEHRTQRQVFGNNGDVSRQDVVRSDLPDSSIDSNLGDPDGGDSGRVVQRNRRDMIRARPYWQYEVSERHRAELGGYYYDADYEKFYVDGPRDFQDYGVNAGWGYRFSPRSMLIGRLRASRYETVFESEAYGAEAEWRTDYSQTSHLYVRLGGQRTDLGNGGESETNVIAGVGGRWVWPTTTAFVDLTQTVGPTSGGSVVERTQARFRLERAVKPRLSIFGGARGIHDEGVSERSTYPTRDYLTGELGFDWRVTRTWSVLGVYNYIWQEYDDEPSDTASNAISLGVVYEPGRRE
jgi:hypothetical protein